MAASAEPPALVDTNVFVYAVHKDTEQHTEARQFLEKSQDSGRPLCVTSQVLAEFYAVATRADHVSVPRTPLEVLAAIDQIIAMPNVILLPAPGDLVGRWMQLAQEHPVTGATIFDVQLTATMLGNDVHRIYTYNTADFAWCSELEVLLPRRQ